MDRRTTERASNRRSGGGGRGRLGVRSRTALRALLCSTYLGLYFYLPFLHSLSHASLFRLSHSHFSLHVPVSPQNPRQRASLLTAPLAPARPAHCRPPAAAPPRPPSPVTQPASPGKTPFPDLLLAPWPKGLRTPPPPVRGPTDPEELHAQRSAERSPARAMFNYLFGHRGEL